MSAASGANRVKSEAELRECVRLSCLDRIAVSLFRPYQGARLAQSIALAIRHVERYGLVREAYSRSREIEDEAAKRWEKLVREARACMAFARKHAEAAGGFKTTAIHDVAPKIALVIDAAQSQSASTGLAAFYSKPPSRSTFLRDEAPFVGDANKTRSELATLTLLAGFWPYAYALDPNKLPTVAQVVQAEADEVRKALRSLEETSRKLEEFAE